MRNRVARLPSPEIVVERRGKGVAPAPATEPISLLARARLPGSHWLSSVGGRLDGEERKSLVTDSGGTLNVSTLEGWLWDAACQIRGAVDEPKFKDFILPLIFLKRLSDVFEDEVGRLADELGDREFAEQVVDEGHGYVRFYVPGEARWTTISKKTAGLGEHLTTAVKAVARENPKLQGVIDVVDFNARTAGQRIVDDPALSSLVQVLGQHRLGIDDVEPDILGRAYEYLLRKFAEGQGQSAGEFYTPREVGVLIAGLLDPEPGAEVYDPCCGSAGLLIKCHLRLVEKHGEQKNGRKVLSDRLPPTRLYGQEINGSTFAMARMNAFLHEMEARVALGDTMRRPAFSEGGRLKRFDLVAANPMWNQKFPTELYLRTRSLRAFRPRRPAGFKRRLGLVAAHGRFPEGRRAYGRGARHGGGEPGQRQHRFQP